MTVESEAYIADPPKEDVDTAPPASGELSPVIVIRRTTFNYIFIATLFLLMGIVIGAYGAFRVERANRSWLNDAIGEAMASQADTIADLVAAQRPPDLEDSNSRFDVTAANNFARGPEDAVVEIIEFSDFNCGFCRRFHAETLPQLLDNYGDQIRFVYRDMPILAQSSLTAAVAARCAGDQGQFWAYHDLLFENQPMLSQPGVFERFAAQLELDVEAFMVCITDDDEVHTTAIVDDYREAQSLGIRGTPAFFINGRPVSGAQPYQVFAGIIQEELEANGAEDVSSAPEAESVPEEGESLS